MSNESSESAVLLKARLDRIETLLRRLIRMTFVITVIVVFFAISVAVRLVIGDKPPAASRMIRANVVVLEDMAGKERMVLDGTFPEGPYLFMKDADGNVRVALDGHDTFSGLSLSEANKTNRIMLFTNPNGAALAIKGEQGSKARVGMVVPKTGSMQVTVHDEMGRLIWSAP